MKTATSYFLSLGVAVFLTGIISVEAQTLSTTRTDDAQGDDAVCTADAYQCPDGSWVGRSGPRCEFICADGSVHGGRSDIDAQNHNSSRSNRTGGVAGPDVEGEDPEYNDPDSDDDGRADIGGGATHNSSRSNRTEGITDPDSDDDSVGDGNQLLESSQRGSGQPEIIENERVLRAHELTHTIQQRIAPRDVDDAGAMRGVYIKIGDIKGEATAEMGIPPTIHGLEVTAPEVRGWDPRTKEAIREHLASLSEITNANDLGLFVAQQVLDHERVERVTVEDLVFDERGMKGDLDSDGYADVVISHRASVRLFGIIHRDVAARTTLTGETETAHTTLEAPWYIRWFSLRTDDEDVKGIARLIHDTAMNSIRNMRA